MAYEWQRSKKDSSRIRILSAAAEHFRTNGITRASVSQIMKAAGFTVGGFYAHFTSKEDLIKKTFRLMSEQVQSFVLNLKGKNGPEKLKEFIDIYLSPSHRDTPSVGCPVAALAAEVSREHSDVRAVFSDEIELLAKQRRSLFGSDQVTWSDSQVYAFMSTYVGAIILARATKGSPVSNKILAAARGHLRTQVDEQIKDGKS